MKYLKPYPINENNAFKLPDLEDKIKQVKSISSDLDVNYHPKLVKILTDILNKFTAEHNTSFKSYINTQMDEGNDDNEIALWLRVNGDMVTDFSKKYGLWVVDCLNTETDKEYNISLKEISVEDLYELLVNLHQMSFIRRLILGNTMRNLND